jgi:hypothetical protein
LLCDLGCYSSHNPASLSYNAAGGKPVAADTLYSVLLQGDLDDLCNVFSCSELAPGVPRVNPNSDSHCSVLIKVLKDYQEVLVGHTTVR